MWKLTVSSREREEMIPVSQQIQDVLSRYGVASGLVFVHCPHTTAGVTINESADPDVRRDICGHLRKLIPQSPSFRHFEGNSDAHIKSSLMGPQLFLMVDNGALVLGQWQEVYFCEWDGPRTRQVWLQFLEIE